MDDNERLLADASSAAVVFAALLGATVAGQLVGIGLDAAMGIHAFWIPCACSVAFEGAVGARVAAARLGRTLTARESGRVSVAYSAALIAISAPLAVWIRASRALARAGAAPAVAGVAAPPHAGAGGLLIVAGIALAVVAATAVRWGLFVAFTPRPR